MGHDEPDEPDEAADRNPGRGRHRGKREQDAALPTDVDAEMAGGGVAEEQAVEGGRSQDDQVQAPMMSGAAIASRAQVAPPSPPSRNEKIWRRSDPDTYIAMVSRAASTEPTA